MGRGNQWSKTAGQGVYRLGAVHLLFGATCRPAPTVRLARRFEELGHADVVAREGLRDPEVLRGIQRGCRSRCWIGGR